jgi:hypothetical protein
MIALGVASFCGGAYGLMKTLTSGTARLRGGRRIRREKNPALYWANVVALGVLLVLSVVLIGIGVYR